ncbi:NAD+ synthase [Candidatus Saganbacteria bacterium]|nr:NAD+ synthase [Candidatus Saganbacteria bacterium]
MKLALAQLNLTVGDIVGNVAKIKQTIQDAKNTAADVVLFPELAITGYPPEDLLLKPQFVTDNLTALKEIAKIGKGIAIYLGFVDRQGTNLFNAAAFIENSKIKTVYHKMNLPNYSVFDERRYFKPGNKVAVVSYKGLKIGLSICEDIWIEKGPYIQAARQGAKLILNINASPYHVGKIKTREKILKQRAKQIKCPIAYLNLVGGQDELVFDGGSMVVNAKGQIIAAAHQYHQEILIVDLRAEGKIQPWMSETEDVYQALVMGVRDYVHKNHFSDVVIGVSGGIDSALTLAIAVSALGKEHVHTIYMPSQYSAEQSFRDAQRLADKLWVPLKVMPIEKIFKAYLEELTPNFQGQPANITEENLQARIRGNYLMALSNKFNWLVLTTGNKSETSTGYSTLYGDMAGGFNVLKDVPKTLVYCLANWRNQEKEIIPRSIIDRPPTAELKPNQKDQDTLPPYDILDEIIKFYVVENKSGQQIVAKGFDPKTVKKMIAMIDRSEYKRRQSPPGPRISPRAFGKDWRLPITNGYTGEAYS